MLIVLVGLLVQLIFRRYKNTINDATHGLTELLKLRPVTYKGNNDGDTLFGGLIAEEVHDAGLTEFVTYNDDNEPDALAYGNMVSLCIKAIQELSKNDALKAKNDARSSQFTALEVSINGIYRNIPTERCTQFRFFMLPPKVRQHLLGLTQTAKH